MPLQNIHPDWLLHEQTAVGPHCSAVPVWYNLGKAQHLNQANAERAPAA